MPKKNITLRWVFIVKGTDNKFFTNDLRAQNQWSRNEDDAWEFSSVEELEKKLKKVHDYDGDTWDGNPGELPYTLITKLHIDGADD